MKPIVTDTYDFPTLIGEGYVYFDKTAFLRRMISGVDGRFFFMSRPRRFGKSLMISTLEQIFKGNKKLFKGLDIAKSDYDWKTYPIIRLDMTAFDQTSGLDVFKRSLAAEFGGTEPIAAFRALIARKAKASHGKGVVALIDEYDSPVSGLWGKPNELGAMREFLQSLAPAYAGQLGYTADELTAFFGPQIKDFAKASKRSERAVVEELLSWYDNYRFSPRSEVRVCNPVSVGQALREQSCESFWERTGSSTLIIERLRKVGKIPLDVESLEVMPKRLDVCDLRKLPLDALMYQGGYLTIKSVLENGKLVLGTPNREVREAIYGGFLDEILQGDSDAFSSAAYDVSKLLERGMADDEALRRILTSVFAMVPHEWKLKSEAEAKRYFLLFMRMAGATINAEVESSNGRADAVLETTKAVYIFEFKYGKTAKEALKQCRQRNYAAPYLADNHSLVYVGVNCEIKRGVIEVEIGGVNGGVNDLLKTIKNYPGKRVPELAELTGISRRTIERYLKDRLSKIIELRGAPKNGGYYAR